MTGFLIALKLLGMALLIILPFIVFFLIVILAWAYFEFKVGHLYAWKNITHRRISPNIIWADDFREVCELFLENPDDARVKRLFYKCIMNSMPLISDGNINPNRCSITGMSSWMLKEQLRVNLKDQYYVENWGDMPKKVV